MPQRAKGARLFLRERAGRDPVYVIKDTGQPEQSTGTGDQREAEIRLAEYIAKKNRRSGPAGPTEMTCAEVLAIYGEEHAVTVADPVRIGCAIDALLPFWGDTLVSDVKGPTCRRYAATRTVTVSRKRLGLDPLVRPAKPATVRRELNVLGAALNHCVREGHLTSAPPVTMPATPETNQRALERWEVARLLRSARRLGYRHLMHFIVLSIYTGTRKSATLQLRLSNGIPCVSNGWFDLNAGILYRMGDDERVTKKRRTPATIPRQLLGHVRRWAQMGHTWAVEWRGARIADTNNGWDAVVAKAQEMGLTWRPTPHTLKHTAITWAIQGGASIEDAAGFFATSVETIERVYWHLSPRFQQGAVGAIERGARQ